MVAWLVAVVENVGDCYVFAVECVGGFGDWEHAVVLVHEVFGFVGGDVVVACIDCFVGGVVGALLDDVVAHLFHCRFLSFVFSWQHLY